METSDDDSVVPTAPAMAQRGSEEDLSVSICEALESMKRFSGIGDEILEELESKPTDKQTRDYVDDLCQEIDFKDQQIDYLQKKTQTLEKRCQRLQKEQNLALSVLARNEAVPPPILESVQKLFYYDDESDIEKREQDLISILQKENKILRDFVAADEGANAQGELDSLKLQIRSMQKEFGIVSNQLKACQAQVAEACRDLAESHKDLESAKRDAVYWENKATLLAQHSSSNEERDDLLRKQVDQLKENLRERDEECQRLRNRLALGFLKSSGKKPLSAEARTILGERNQLP